MPSLRSVVRSLRTCFVLILLFLPLPGCQPGAGAPEEEAAVRRGEDLLAGGRTLVIRDTYAGDVILAGGNIAFTGTAGGDYLGAGGQQEIGGRVAGSVRAAGGELWLRAAVERNATLAGGRIELQPASVIGGNAYLAGGEIRVEGEVTGFLQATGGEVLLNGSVGEDAEVQAGRLRVGPGAQIGGDLRHNVRPEHVTIEPGAQIAGEVIALPPPRVRPGLRVLRIIFALGFLVAGAAAIALLPRVAEGASRALQRRPGAAVGFGLLWVIGAPIVAAMLAMTVIGIPLALILIALYLISLYLGRAVLALWLGRIMLGERTRPDRGGLVLSFLLGALVLLVVGLLPVAGTLVTILATLLGLGAAVLVLGTRAPATE